MGTAFNHIAWVVKDQDKVVRFLTQHFDCKAGKIQTIEGEWAEQLAKFKGENGKNVHATVVPVTNSQTATKIEVLKFEKPESLRNKDNSKLNLEGFRHICFVVDDIYLKKAELEDAGYEFFGNIVTVNDFEVMTVYLWGPEDTVIQLTEPLKH